MNYTENYQLPQWEETDRVLMEDFNDAMAKVDAGMEQAAPVTLLRHAVIAGDTTDYALDLTDIPFSDYQEIGIYFTMTATQYTNLAMYFNNYEEFSDYNNETNNYADSLGLLYTTIGVPVSGHIRLLVNNHGAAISYYALGRYMSLSGGSCDKVNADTLTTLRFKASEGVIQSGGTFWVFGVKKLS